MVSLSELKKNSTSNLSKLVSEANKETNKSYDDQDDGRFWKAPKLDASETAFAIIRFLPQPKVDAQDERAMQWVKVFSHGFQNDMTGHWYIENSRTTINEADPIAEINRKLWNTNTEENQNLARKQKRKTSYYSNIYVVKDPTSPENEGKVFLYRYGKKIFDKILDIVSPNENFGEDPSDPFCFWNGRDFKLKIRKVKDFINYDLSEFTPPKPISDPTGKPLSDEDIEKIWESEYSLLEFYSPSNFKSYDELLNRYKVVTGEIGQSFLDKEDGHTPTKENKSTQSKTPVQKKEEDVDKKTASVKGNPEKNEVDEDDPPFDLVDESTSDSSSDSDDEIDFDKLLADLED